MLLIHKYVADMWRHQFKQMILRCRYHLETPPFLWDPTLYIPLLTSGAQCTQILVCPRNDKFANVRGFPRQLRKTITFSGFRSNKPGIERIHERVAFANPFLTAPVGRAAKFAQEMKMSSVAFDTCVGGKRHDLMTDGPFETLRHIEVVARPE